MPDSQQKKQLHIVDPEENIKCDVSLSNQSGSNQTKIKAKAGKEQFD